MSIEEELTTDNTVAILGVGDRLKVEREARKLTLDDISQALKIPRRVLDQVEANAWTELPGHTFARGIVRGYAKFLQLDPEVLLLELEKAPMPKRPVLELPMSTRTALPVPGQSNSRDRLAMIAGVLLVAGSIMAYFLVPEDWFSGKSAAPAPSVVRESMAPSIVPEKNSAPTSAPSAVPLAGPNTESPVAAVPGGAVSSATPVASPISPTTAVAGTHALILYFDQMSWVEVKGKNGEMLLSENVPAGAERTVNVEPPIGLALGNAEGVRVSFRGQTVDLKPHTRQKVARLSLE